MNIRYYTNGNGQWWKTTWQKQCPDEVFLSDKCQGVTGHQGAHWCYRSNGSYAWSRNKNDPNPGRHSSGWTPPDAVGYIEPKVKQQEYYMNFSETVEVIDRDKIRKLEDGELDDGEDATIDSPVTDEELQWLRDSGRLDEIIKEYTDEDH